jgi:hypothetical protein
MEFGEIFGSSKQGDESKKNVYLKNHEKHMHKVMADNEFPAFIKGGKIDVSINLKNTTALPKKRTVNNPLG